MADRHPVFYGETLLADAVREQLGVALLQPTDDWLPRLPERFRLREVSCLSVADARKLRGPRFIKPVDEKWFRAAVYASGDELPLAASPGDEALVLAAEPVRSTPRGRREMGARLSRFPETSSGGQTIGGTSTP